MRRMLIFVCCMVLLLVACGGGDDDKQPAPVQPSPTPFINPTLPEARSVLPTAIANADAAEPAWVQVIQGVVDLPSVNIWLGDRQIARAIRPLEMSRLVQVTTGEHVLRITEVVSRSQTDAPTLYEAQIIIADGDVVVLSGVPDDIAINQLNQTVTALQPGQSQISLANYVAGRVPSTLVLNEQVLLATNTAGQLSDPVTLAADIYRFYVLVDGVLVTRLEQRLVRGFAYTVVVVGNAGNAAVLLLDVETPPQTAVRVTNASPDAPPLRLVLENHLIADDLAFGSTRDFQVLVSGDYIVNILEVGTDEVLVGSARLQLRPYQMVDIVIYGPDDDLQIGVFELDPSPVRQGRSRFSLIHAAIGVGGVRMTNVSGADFGLNARYGRNGSIEIDALFTELRFFDDRNVIVEAPVRALEIEPSKSYVYIVTGRSEENPIFLVSDLRTAIPTTDSDGLVPPVAGSPNTSKVYVVNLYPEPIRLDFNDETLIFGLGNLAISQPFLMTIDFYMVRLYNATTNSLLSETNVLMRSGERYFVIYILDNTTVLTIGDIEDRPSPTLTRVRFFNGIPDSPELFVAMLSPYDENNATLGYGQMSASFEIPTGRTGLEVFDRATFTSVAQFPNLQLKGGATYEIILVAGEDNNIGLQVLERQP